MKTTGLNLEESNFLSEVLIFFVLYVCFLFPVPKKMSMLIKQNGEMSQKRRSWNVFLFSFEIKY